jgi:hypothetical protein
MVIAPVMNNTTAISPRPCPLPICADERERTVVQIESFIRETVLSMEPEAPRSGPGRPAVLPALALWTGLLVCVLKGFSSRLDLWRLLSSRGLWFYPRFPVSDQAVYNRLDGAGSSPMEELFCRVSAALRERLGPFIQQFAPFAAEVVALDESTLDPVARRLPAMKGLSKGDARLLPGKLAGLFDLRRQQWLKISHIPDATRNEKLSARAMVEELPPGSLILADLGYFAFAWFDHLTGLGHYWISRARSKTSYQLLHVFYQSGQTLDALVYLGAHRSDRAASAVRLVQYQVGASTYRYITNVLDPKALPILEIARLYARRWDIEMAVDLVKTHLGLHLLWSTKQVGILQQVWAVLIISQILQALRLEIAGRAEVDPFEVSIELMIRWMPQFAHAGVDPVAAFVEQGRDLGFIRPSRRTVIKAPVIPPEAMVPPPEGLILTRKARYGNWDRSSRPKKPN